MEYVTALGDSAVQLRAMVWTQNHHDGFELKCDLYKSIKQRFGSEGIEIPFPHRTVVLKNKEQHLK
jgi:small conductance mechanosensitive channel